MKDLLIVAGYWINRVYVRALRIYVLLIIVLLTIWTVLGVIIQINK